ncbi:hypothetical protein N865_07280 [Intrasporangium oryzae NRRL B-24470]|uniref:Uncharacterized protein n=1 Tax=Intrasporangium oryzae NRRL B-24470 TaxID=1386089 RepID=W9GBB0_9MICO|nr:hypothetical protein [Intrasporangium oryzae]EWT02108.1 hypothetical protein N865_07280 [Intrasporangium oryzae NRRL B-24470]
MIASTPRDDVRGYVARVRVALGDLPADDVDELTQGMEADLAELVAESGGRVRDRLGTPEAYAAELRSAAGLPPRVVASASTGIGDLVRRLRDRWDDRVRRWAWLADLVPVWWVFRGIIGAWAVAGLLGRDPHSWLMWFAGAAISFWLGRAGRAWTGPRRRLATTLNVVTVLVTLLVVVPSELTHSGPDWSSGEVVYSPPTPGLAYDGFPVTGYFVYDAQGRPVPNARVFDQDGHPLPPQGANTNVYIPPATIAPLPDAPGPAEAPSSSATPSAMASVGGSGATTPVPSATTQAATTKAS